MGGTPYIGSGAHYEELATTPFSCHGDGLLMGYIRMCGPKGVFSDVVVICRVSVSAIYVGHK